MVLSSTNCIAGRDHVHCPPAALRSSGAAYAHHEGFQSGCPDRLSARVCFREVPYQAMASHFCIATETWGQVASRPRRAPPWLTAVERDVDPCTLTNCASKAFHTDADGTSRARHHALRPFVYYDIIFHLACRYFTVGMEED